MRISEEISRAANVESGKIDINDSAVRDNINSLIDGITCHGFMTPYIALERVGKVLASYHIYLPKYTFMEGDSGLATFPAHQFGEKVGMSNDGQVVTKATTPYTIYFEYQMNDYGKYDIFCSIVTEDELEELMDDVGEDLEEAVTLPETGPRRMPGANSKASIEVEDEDQTSSDMSAMIRAIVKRAMQPGIKFAGDETGPNKTLKSAMTEEAKKKVLSELNKFGAAYKAARASGQSKFTHNGKEYSSELDNKPVTPAASDTSDTPVSAQASEPAKTTQVTAASVAAPSSASVPMPRPKPAQATAAPAADSKPAETSSFFPKLSAYSPQRPGSSTSNMEGGYASSRPGPDNKSEVRTLHDYATGTSQYVTLAGHPSQYGKEYTIPSITYNHPETGAPTTLTNVRGVVHDTGSAFKGDDAKSGQRFDVATGHDMSDKSLASQPWSMKNDVEFKSGWKQPEEEPKKTQVASIDENEDENEKIAAEANKEENRAIGIDKLKDAFKQKDNEVKERMDNTIGQLKKQDFFDRTLKTSPDKNQRDV